MREKCPDCGSRKIVSDYVHGEIYCRNCGFVLEDTLFDFGPEWRAFDREQVDKRERTGGLLRFAKLGKGLTTEIDKYDRDIKGRGIPAERKAKLYRMRKLHKRMRTSTSLDKNLSIALPELNRICSHLNIPGNVREEAARLYTKVAKEGLVRGRSIESMVAAVIFFISRKNHIPKTLDELEKLSGVKKKDIGKSYRKIMHQLKLEIPVVKPADYVPKLASQLGISGKVEAKATQIIEKATEKGIIAGKTPRSVALGAIYLAAELVGEEVKKVKFKGISPHTIKMRYEELRKMIGEKI
jgi:transcription initiation factor TFIIB